MPCYSIYYLCYSKYFCNYRTFPLSLYIDLNQPALRIKKSGKISWMIIWNLIREHEFMATVVLFENKLIKTKNIEKT